MRYKIDDIVTLIMDYRGKTPKKLGMDWTENSRDILAISAKNIKNGRLINKDKAHYGDENLYKKWMKDGDIKVGDILMTSEAPLGESYLITKPLKAILSQRTFLIRLNKELADPWFFYSLIQSPMFKMKLLAKATGTTVIGIKQKELRKIIVDLPSLNIQKKIGYYFKVIDQKIRLNNQINDNLVELVDSYFINFLNNVTTVEKTIEDIGTVVGGGTPSKKIAAYWNGDIAWVTPKDLSQHPLIFTSSGENYITGLGLAKGSAKLLPTNTILFSSRAPIGYISIAKNNLATNQGFKSVIPNKEYSFQFIYELLKHETAAIKNEANGSTFKEISGKKLKQHIINIPNSEDTSKFNEITKPIFKQLRKLEEENEKLLAIKKELLEKYF
nr:restriction endonuclease subunit S [Limosilactobacillus reuteri]